MYEVLFITFSHGNVYIFFHYFQGKFFAEYRTSNVILHGEPVPLNPDHTHFIFVDDGYRIRYGGVAAMRSKIEQKIQRPKAGLFMFEIKVFQQYLMLQITYKYL